MWTSTIKYLIGHSQRQQANGNDYCTLNQRLSLTGGMEPAEELRITSIKNSLLDNELKKHCRIALYAYHLQPLIPLLSSIFERIPAAISLKKLSVNRQNLVNIIEHLHYRMRWKPSCPRIGLTCGTPIPIIHESKIYLTKIFSLSRCVVQTFRVYHLERR